MLETKTQTFKIDKLSSLQFEDNDIIKITRSHNTCKAHEHDDISISMLKLCDLVVVKPLQSSSEIVLIKVCFQIYGINQMYAPFIRKLTNK